MSPMCFLKHLIDVPFLDIPGVGLVESDLQFGTKLLLDHPVEVVFRDEYIHALRMIILDFNGAAIAVMDGQSLFF